MSQKQIEEVRNAIVEIIDSKLTERYEEREALFRKTFRDDEKITEDIKERFNKLSKAKFDLSTFVKRNFDVVVDDENQLTFGDSMGNYWFFSHLLQACNYNLSYDRFYVEELDRMVDRALEEANLTEATTEQEEAEILTLLYDGKRAEEIIKMFEERYELDE